MGRLGIRPESLVKTYVSLRTVISTPVPDSTSLGYNQTTIWHTSVWPNENTHAPMHLS